MVNRYYITGVQIGIILALLKKGNEGEILKLIDEIESEQYLGTKEELHKFFKGEE